MYAWRGAAHSAACRGDERVADLEVGVVEEVEVGRARSDTSSVRAALPTRPVTVSATDPLQRQRVLVPGGVDPVPELAVPATGHRREAAHRGVRDVGRLAATGPVERGVVLLVVDAVEVVVHACVRRGEGGVPVLVALGDELRPDAVLDDRQAQRHERHAREHHGDQREALLGGGSGHGCSSRGSGGSSIAPVRWPVGTRRWAGRRCSASR